jgi:hypothetical protein
LAAALLGGAASAARRAALALAAFSLLAIVAAVLTDVDFGFLSFLVVPLALVALISTFIPENRHR